MSKKFAVVSLAKHRLQRDSLSGFNIEDVISCINDYFVANPTEEMLFYTELANRIGIEPLQIFAATVSIIYVCDAENRTGISVDDGDLKVVYTFIKYHGNLYCFEYCSSTEVAAVRMAPAFLYDETNPVCTTWEDLMKISDALEEETGL